MGEMLEVSKNEFLHNCPVCGKEAGIYEWSSYGDGRGDGIGDVRCSDPTCSAHKWVGPISRSFHYSGKYGIKKAYAVGAWNTYCEMFRESTK